MRCSSATDSAIDSFHTAQEGTSVCISYENGAVWRHGCKMDEVTSRVSAPHPSKRHKQHAYTSSRLQHPSTLQSTTGASLARASNAPESMLGKAAMPLQNAPPETSPACKRLCTGALNSQPVTPETPLCQSCCTELGDKPTDAPSAPAQPNEETTATPATPCTQPQRRRSGNPKAAEVAVLQTVTRKAHISSIESSLPSVVHSEELLGELGAGVTSPNLRAQVHLDTREVMMRIALTDVRGQMSVYCFLLDLGKCSTGHADWNNCSSAAAGGCMPSQAGSQGRTCSSARAECNEPQAAELLCSAGATCAGITLSHPFHF